MLTSRDRRDKPTQTLPRQSNYGSSALVRVSLRKRRCSYGFVAHRSGGRHRNLPESPTIKLSVRCINQRKFAPIRSSGAVSEPLIIEAMPRLLHFGQNRPGWINLRKFGLVHFSSQFVFPCYAMRESLGVINSPLSQLGQLKTLGYAPDIAANGSKALEALQSVNYDAVFMDCQMPEMDGFETTAEIRRRSSRSETRTCATNLGSFWRCWTTASARLS